MDVVIAISYVAVATLVTVGHVTLYRLGYLRRLPDDDNVELGVGILLSGLFWPIVTLMVCVGLCFDAVGSLARKK